MANIKPKLTISANSSAATDPGPATIALNLSASPTSGSSDVTTMSTQVYTTTAAHVRIYEHTDDQRTWVYLKNLETVVGTGGTLSDIYIGDASADLTAGGGEDNRLLTLQAGDFALLPMSGRKDLYAEGANAGDKLEVWVFNKVTPA